MGRASRRKSASLVTLAQALPESRDTAGSGTVSPADIAIAAFLVIAIFVVYWQTLNFGFINYDDPDYVTGNAHVRAGLTGSGIAWAFGHSFAGNWFPLTSISHMLDVQFFGLDAGLHHLTNVSLHALTAVLLFILLLRITRARWASAMVAAVFALHPLHVESVASIAQRKDVLSGLFWMLTLLAYAGYVARPGRGRYALALALFGLGLMTKPTLVTLPVVLILLDYWPYARGWRLAEKVPFFVLSVAVCAVTWLVHARAGAAASLDVFPIALRIENALVSYAIYVIKMFWPSHLAVFYPYSRALALPAALAGAALIGMTLLAFRMASTRPWLIAGWLWYLVTLLPVIGLLQIGEQSRADRYTYIPAIGLTIALVWAASEVLARWPRVETGVGALVCAACMVLAWVQVSYWRDGISLFRHSLAVTQNNYIARMNLGAALSAAGKNTDATADLTEAVRLRPQSAAARSELGRLLAKQGKIDDALVQLKTAEALSPDDATVHFRLATVLADSGRQSEAAPEFLETVRLDPANADAYYNLGIVRFSRGRFEDAASDFASAVKLNPDDPSAHFNFGVALARLGRFAESTAQLREALRLNPNIPGAQQALDDAIATQNGVLK